MTLLALLYILLPAVVILLGRPTLRTFAARRRSLLLYVARGLSLAVLLLTLAGGFVACESDRILFHDESSVLAIAAAFQHGQPLYPSTREAVEYGLLYGPGTYLLYLPPILLRAMHIGVYQAWGMLALVLATAFVYLAARRLLSSSEQALAAITLFALLLSPLILSVWSIKADVWILLFSACGLWAAVSLSRWPAAAVIALCGAVLVDLKAPLLILALVPCAILWQEARKAAMAAALLIAPLALAPFALPGISLTGYLTQLNRATYHGLSPHILLLDLPYFLFLTLPTIALLRIAHTRSPRLTKAWIRQHLPFLLLLAAVIATALLSGSKKGAGPWHGFAIILPLLFLDAHLWRLASTPAESRATSATTASPGIAFAAIMLVLAPLTLLHAIRSRFRDPAPYASISMRGAERELNAILQQHPRQTLQMGVAGLSSYNLTFVRPLLQLAGQPLILDPNTRNESDLIAQPVSPALLHALETCSVDLWLIPKGGEPFSMPSLYALDGSIAPQPLYPRSFQLAFLTHYRLLPTSNRYFDLWTASRQDGMTC